jgi:hypothetical protein
LFSEFCCVLRHRVADALHGEQDDVGGRVQIDVIGVECKIELRGVIDRLVEDLLAEIGELHIGAVYEIGRLVAGDPSIFGNPQRALLD